MSATLLGLVAALGAMLAWAFGDLAIQRGTRLFGDWATLFLVGLVGMIGLAPFAYGELAQLTREQINFFLFAGAVTLVAALFLFEGLRRGKLAVIEPVFGLELPFTVAFGVWLGGEQLSLALYGLIAVIFIGLLLTVTREVRHLHFHRTMFERGVAVAAVGAVAMGLVNFLTGAAARDTSPLLTIWFIHSLVAVACLIFLLGSGEWQHVWRTVRRYPLRAVQTGLLDNIAWVCYATAMTLIPISIATALSESYIVLTVFLGFFVNRERLRLHQLIGVIVVVVGVVSLALQIT